MKAQGRCVKQPQNRQVWERRTSGSSSLKFGSVSDFDSDSASGNKRRHRTYQYDEKIEVVKNNELQVHVNATDIPPAVQQSIMQFSMAENTSEEELGARGPPPTNEVFQTSPNSTFVRPRVNNEPMDTTTSLDKNEPPFQTPRKFSTTFKRLVREKSKKT